MNSFRAFSILVVFGALACTQFVENDEGKNTYTGSDGCVYCHTNDARLKALAPAEEGGGSAGGG